MCSLSLVTNWRYFGVDLKSMGLDSNNKYVFKAIIMCSLSLITIWRHFGVDLKSVFLDSNNKYVFKQS